MMSLTKAGFEEKEYSTLTRKIDLIRERTQRLKGQQTEREIRVKHVQDLQDYLMALKNEINKFDEDLFRRVVEKVRVRSMVEVEFVFKAGIEMRDILG